MGEWTYENMAQRDTSGDFFSFACFALAAPSQVSYGRRLPKKMIALSPSRLTVWGGGQGVGGEKN